MPNPITITLRAEDAEPFLREEARKAAFYGALGDYITKRTWDTPGGRSLADDRQCWQREFLRAKRIVESFGVEYEPTSEEETMTVQFPMKNEKRTPVVVAGLIKYTRVEGGEPDYKKPEPRYRRGVHAEACIQAADRVVRRWRATLVD